MMNSRLSHALLSYVPASAIVVGTMFFARVVAAEYHSDSTNYLCSDIARAVTTDHRGRILVVGSAFDNRVLEWPTGHAHFGDLAVSRLLRCGRPDKSFGDGGTVIVDLDDFDDAQDVLVNGKFIDIVGTTAAQDGAERGPADIVLLRLDHRGRHAKYFGHEGLAVLDLEGNESIAGIDRAPYGSLYVAGTTTHSEGDIGFVAKINHRGRLSRHFGDDGVFYFHFDEGNENGKILGIKSTRKGIFVGAQTTQEGVATAVSFKLNHDGELADDYGDCGVAMAPVGGTLGFAGTAFHTRRGSAAVSIMSQNDDGTAVASTVLFDPYGDVLEGPDGPAFQIDVPGGSLDAPNGGGFWWGESLIIAGATYPEDFATGDAFITRVDETGVIDESFGGGMILEHLELEYAAFNDLALSRSGILAAGWEFSEGIETLPHSDALLVRYLDDGSLDPRFGQGTGVVLHDFHGGRKVCGPVEHIESSSATTN